MTPTKRSIVSRVAGLALVASLAAGGAMAQQIVIDAATGQEIMLNDPSGAAMATLSQGGTVQANMPGGNTVTLRGEIYKPGIWVDPDGCQHWVMDDGVEGYMAPRLNRDGYPVCGQSSAATFTPQPQMVRVYDTPMHGKYGGKW